VSTYQDLMEISSSKQCASSTSPLQSLVHCFGHWAKGCRSEVSTDQTGCRDGSFPRRRL